MDLRTYPTRRIYETPPFHCTVCVEPSESADGYIDIGPADILCVPCARRAAALLEPIPFDGYMDSSATVSAVTPTFTATNTLICEDCGRTFTRPAALGSHRRSHRIPA